MVDLARRDVQAIAEPRQRSVFVRRLRIEELAGVEPNLADARALRSSSSSEGRSAERGASILGARALTLGSTRALRHLSGAQADQGDP